MSRAPGSAPLQALRAILAQLGPAAGHRNVVELATGDGHLSVHIEPRRGRTEIGVDLIADGRPRPANLAQGVEDIARRHGASECRISSNYMAIAVRPERAPLALLHLLELVGAVEQVQR